MKTSQILIRILTPLLFSLPSVAFATAPPAENSSASAVVPTDQEQRDLQSAVENYSEVKKGSSAAETKAALEQVRRVMVRLESRHVAVAFHALALSDTQLKAAVDHVLSQPAPTQVAMGSFGRAATLGYCAWKCFIITIIPPVHPALTSPSYRMDTSGYSSTTSN